MLHSLDKHAKHSGLFIKIHKKAREGVRRTTKSSVSGLDKSMLAIAVNGLCVMGPTGVPAICQYVTAIFARAAKYGAQI
jgi:hypothetical protein